jgi:hypothetical protein
MSSITVREIDARLRQLPPEKLAVVYEFVSFLLERENTISFDEHDDGALPTMRATEAVLRRDWDSPEEDAAWAHL